MTQTITDFFSRTANCPEKTLHFCFRSIWPQEPFFIAINQLSTFLGMKTTMSIDFHGVVSVLRHFFDKGVYFLFKILTLTTEFQKDGMGSWGHYSPPTPVFVMSLNKCLLKFYLHITLLSLENVIIQANFIKIQAEMLLKKIEIGSTPHPPLKKYKHSL